MLDTKVKVFHESISCVMKSPWNCISWNALKEKFQCILLLRKSIFLCEDKDQLSFCRKACWNADRSSHLFISNWWIAFFKHLHVLFNFVTIQYTEINLLCKHRKKVRSSQACISINSCTELSKTKFSLWVLLSQSKCSLEPKNFLRGSAP